MGLDVTAYKNATKIGSAANYDEWERQYSYEKTVFIGYQPQGFGTHLAPLEPNGVYLVNRNDSEVVSVSYGGYNKWRDRLCHMANRISAEHLWAIADKAGTKALPFYWLINFSDCEGYIGSEKAALLASDFARFQEAANEMDENFLERYNEWRKACELAAQGGLLDFH